VHGRHVVRLLLLAFTWRNKPFRIHAKLHIEKAERNCRILQRLLLSFTKHSFLSNSTSNLFLQSRLKWIVRAPNLTLQGILPTTIYFTSEAGEYREGFIGRTKVPSPNFSTVYIWDLFHIFVHTNSKKKVFTLFWQIPVLYTWKTINFEVASNLSVQFYHLFSKGIWNCFIHEKTAKDKRAHLQLSLFAVS